MNNFNVDEQEKIKLCKYFQIIIYANEQLLKVFYSKDGLKRILVIKNNKGFYQYLPERLHIFNKTEFNEINKNNKKIIYGIWQPLTDGYSLYDSEQSLLMEIKSETQFMIEENLNDVLNSEDVIKL